MTDREFNEKYRLLRRQLQVMVNARCKLSARVRMNRIAELVYEYDGTPIEETKLKLKNEITNSRFSL